MTSMIDHAKSGMASSARKQRRAPEGQALLYGCPALLTQHVQRGPQLTAKGPDRSDKPIDVLAVTLARSGTVPAAHEAPATAPLSKPDLQASGSRIVLPAAEQPIHRLGICVVELRGLGPHIVDRGERANDRRTCGDAGNPGHQLRVVTLGRLAEKGSDVAGPGEGRDVGDRIALSAEEGHHREPNFQHLENPPDLGAVTIERIVVPFR